MARLSLDQEARVWASLDDNLRNKIRSGELTIEQASEYVIPTGDLFLERGRAETASASSAVPARQTDAGEEEYGLGTMLDIATTRPVQTFDSIGATIDSESMARGDEIERLRERGAGATLSEKLAARNATLGEDIGSYTPGLGFAGPLVEAGAGAVADVIDTGLLTAQAAMSTTEDIRARQEVARQKLDTNLNQLRQTSEYLKSLPQNPYTNDFINGVNEGDWAKVAWNAIPATATVLGEQAPDIAITAAVVATTAYATKNPTAVAVATRAATSAGSSLEYGSDLANLWDAVPEEERSYEKFKEIQEHARQVTATRALVESAVPGIGARLGATNFQRVLSETAAQMASGGLGEDLASRVSTGTGTTLTERIRSGEGASAGEIALEMLADSAGAVYEGGPALLRAAAEDRAFEAAGRRADEIKQEFARGVLELEANQAIAERNRAEFDAEVEADKAIEALKMQSPTQTEMPFGSGFGGNVPTDENNPARNIPENDRTPTIADMFTGESMAATRAEERRAGNVEEANRIQQGEGPTLTDDEFEVRSQRTSTARNQIDQRKQEDFEVTKQKEANRRRLMAEDQTVLKAERQLQSTADITREAQNRLEYEKQQIRSRPENRRGANNARLTETLAAFERKRKPELIKEVREERLKRINDARERVIAEENRQLELEDIDIQNELGRRQDARRAAEAPAAEPTPTDLFSEQPQTELLPQTEQPARPTYTGKLTEQQQARELAAGQLERQKQKEKIAPAQMRAEAAAIEAEIPTVAKAIEKATAKKASLTAKTYAKSEQNAINAIVEDELTKNPNRPREELTKAVASRVAEWRKQNPRPDSVPNPEAAGDTITQQAQQVAARKATADKAKETKAVNAELKREIDKGATPEQAAEIVRNRRLTPAEDAALRRELGQKDSSQKDMPASADFLGEVHPEKIIPEVNNRVKSDTPAMYDALKTELTSESPSIVRMLEIIINEPKVPAFQKLLARRLLPTARALKIKLAPAPQGNNDGGTYSSRTNTIVLNVLRPEVILHEVLHGVLSNALLRPTLVGQGMRIQVLKKELEQLRLNTIRDFDNQLVTRSGNVTNKGLGTRLAAGNGPLSSVDEFISYFMTEPDLQFLLNQVPANPGWVSKVQAMAKAFYKAVAEFLGLRTKEEASALEQLSNNVSELLGIVETNREAAAELSALQASGPVLAANEVDIETADFSDPVTKRSMIVLGNGRFSIKLKPEWLSSPVGSLVDALTAGAGRSSVITEIFERSQSSTSALILRAEQLFRAIDYSLEKQAVAEKQGLQEFRDKFTDSIKKFEAMPEGLGKRQEAKKMRNEFGLAARSYFMMRRTMDNLSRDILAQRLNDPRPFTEQEAGIYRSIKENIGQYYTRVYASNTKGIGEERARKLWNEYEKWAKGNKKVQFKDGYETVRNAAVFVRDHMLTIPDRDTLAEMPLDKLQKLADAWGIMPLTGADLDAPLLTEGRRDALIEGLQKFADATPEARDKKALALVEELLFSRENATLTNYFRGAKQDRTIVTDREMVPEPLRKLMGEYEDLPLRAMITITRQAEFRARNKAFNELLAEESGNRILTDEEFTEQGMSPRDWTKLEGVAYGSLDGLWVRTDLAQKIEDSAEVQRTFDQVLAMAENRPLETVNFLGRKALAGWAKAAGTIKSVQLVWNLGNLVFNFMGGPLILLSNGHLNPKHAARAFSTAQALIRGAAAPGGTLTADMEKVVRAGITDSAFMGEIRAVELEKLRQLTLDALRSPVEQGSAKAVTTGRSLTRAWRETYAMADVVWKIANFYSEEARLTDYYKAEGIDVSPEMIEREAARKTNVSNFSYKRVPNLFKIGEKAGLTYIMPYIYETFRATAGSFVVGLSDIATAKDAKTAKGKALMLSSGVRRMTGSLLAMGMAQQMVFALVNQLADVGEEEEEWVEKLKAFLPEYKRDSDYLYMGKDENNKPVLFEFSRLDPMGPASEFYRMMLRGAEPDEYIDATKELVIGNPYGIGILKAVLGGGSTNTRLEDIHPALYETLVNAGNAASDGSGKRLAKVADQLMPSWLARAVDPRNTAPEELEMGWLLPYAGIQLYKIEPERTIQFAGKAFTAEKRELRTQVYDFLRIQHELTDEELLDEFIRLRKREDKSYDELENLYEGMIKLDVPQQQALMQLKSAGVADEDLVQIASGGYRPEGSNLVSLQGLERSWAAVSRDQNVTAEQKARYLANIQRVLRLVGEGRVPIKE